MAWSAIIGGGLALLGGLSGSSAAKKASREQVAATRAALAEEKRQFDVTQENLRPWLETGRAGLGRMRDLLGLEGGTALSPEQVMEMDPGYEFRLGEGLKAGRNIAGARGMLNSGSTLKALTRFGQDYASNEFGNIYSRLAGVSGTGQQTGTTLGGLGAQNAGTIGNLLTGAANARGAAAISGANAWTNAFNRVGDLYTQNALMKKYFGGGGTTQLQYAGGQ